MTSRQRFEQMASWLYDFLTLHPEGEGTYDADCKSAWGVFGALLAFVATQTGALTLIEQFNIGKLWVVLIYVGVSLIVVGLTARLLRLHRAPNKPTDSKTAAAEHPSADPVRFYDQGTVLFGKFVLYISIIAAIIFATGYSLGLFSPHRLPFRSKTVAMSNPRSLSVSNPDPLDPRPSPGLFNDILDARDARSFAVFLSAIKTGLRPNCTF